MHTSSPPNKNTGIPQFHGLVAHWCISFGSSSLSSVAGKIRLRVFVLELHDFLGRLEQEGRLTVRERYDGALCQISANEQENFRSVECWAMMVKLFKKFIDSTAILTLSMSLGSPMTTAPARLRLI